MGTVEESDTEVVGLPMAGGGAFYADRMVSRGGGACMICGQQEAFERIIVDSEPR